MVLGQYMATLVGTCLYWLTRSVLGGTVLVLGGTRSVKGVLLGTRWYWVSIGDL